MQSSFYLDEDQFQLDIVTLYDVREIKDSSGDERNDLGLESARINLHARYLVYSGIVRD